MSIQSIDIRSSNVFQLLQPWKNNSLVTIDGWGRYAEISFVGTDRMRIKNLVNFPRMRHDNELITFPEISLIMSSTTEMMHHLAVIDKGIIKTHIPKPTWVHTVQTPVLLDKEEGIICYGYTFSENYNTKTCLLFYNYYKDEIIYDSGDNFDIYLRMSYNNILSLGNKCMKGSNSYINKKIFFDWRNKIIIENKLTDVLNFHNVRLSIGQYRNIHLGKKFLIDTSRTLSQKIKINWNDDFSDVNVIPLSYLLPSGNSLNQMIISIDGNWGTALINGYRGLRGEMLLKRGFFHFDDRYPNGISMPVIVEDYEELVWDHSAFVNHPIHGMCFAQEWHKREWGRDRLYLRLYKMSEVLAEINRQILEKANQIIR